VRVQQRPDFAAIISTDAFRRRRQRFFHVTGWKSGVNPSVSKLFTRKDLPRGALVAQGVVDVSEMFAEALATVGGGNGEFRGQGGIQIRNFFFRWFKKPLLPHGSHPASPSTNETTLSNP
jgi:hypothetical protein